MKKLFSLFWIAVLCCLTSIHAQDYRNASTPITFLGIDFSRLIFLLEDESLSDNDLQNKYFKGWNDLIVAEKDNFDLVKATGHQTVDYDVDAVGGVNDNAKGPFITANGSEFVKLTEADVALMVKKYNVKGSGVGLVFIAEGFSKGRKQGNFWVVYIDMANKTVLKAVRVSKEPAGFGIRNYWAGAVKKILKDFPIR